MDDGHDDARDDDARDDDAATEPDELHEPDEPDAAGLDDGVPTGAVIATLVAVGLLLVVGVAVAVVTHHVGPPRAATSGPSVTPSVTTSTTTAPLPPLTPSTPAHGKGNGLLHTIRHQHHHVPPPPQPTLFRVGTFNLLGASHTTHGQRHGRYRSGTVRMGYAVDLIRRADLSVVGMQEMQPPQYAVFHRRLGSAWGIYGPSAGRAVMANSIAWRNDTWTFVYGSTEPVPYFGGHIRPMPFVLLRNKATGRAVWFVNVHNPANAHGPAARFRAEAVRGEARLINRLSGAEGGHRPVVFTGDMNDRDKLFCPLTHDTLLRASAGGIDTASSGCQPPAHMDVDWIFGTPDVTWVNHYRYATGLIRRTTDHPMVFADAEIPPATALPSSLSSAVPSTGASPH